MCSFVGCQTDNCEVTETIQATTASVVTEETSETKNITETKSTTEAPQTSSDNVVETITIAGQEFSVEADEIILYLNESVDISALSRLRKIKSLQLNNVSDGGTSIEISGFDFLYGCETIESISIQASFNNNEDISILESMPNLKTLCLYGIESYPDWNLNLPAIEDLYLVGTFDLSRLEHLTSLKGLGLEYNDSTDLSPLKNIEGLKGLRIME